jgi:hypothetical protein
VVLAIFDFLPGKYDKRWSIVLLIMTFFTLGVFYASTRFILRTDVVPSQVIGMFLASFIISFIVCLLGYLNARVWCISSGIGLLAGLFMLVSIFLDYGKNGWEDIIGVIAFMGMAAIGVVAGGVGELIAFIVHKARSNK